MSMPTASLLLQGSKCTKFPRESRIAVPSVAPPAITSVSWPTAVTRIVVPDTDATSLGASETAPAKDLVTSNALLPSPIEPSAHTAATWLSQAPAVIATDTLPTTIITTTTADTLSASTTSFLYSVHHEHIPLSSQTDNQTPTLSSSQAVQPSSTEDSEYLFGAAGLVTSATQPSLAIRTTSTAIPTATEAIPGDQTSAPNPIDQSHSSSSNASLRIILASAIGGVAFVALALAVGYYFMRSKRRSARGSTSPSTGEENFPATAEKIPTLILPGGAARSGYQSRRSFLSDAASSVCSLPIHMATVPVSKPEYTYHDPRSSAIPRAANTNPFLDLTERTYKSTSSRGSTNQSDHTMRNPFADPSSSPGIASPSTTITTNLRQSQMSQRQRPVSIAWGGSIYSNGSVSLGSTLILPNGRSSSGSSLVNRLSYPFTVNELSDAGGGEGYYDPGARVSTRSDPFDLEYPAKAAIVHRRSSTIIPVAQM